MKKHHHLLSMSLPDIGGDMHCYLMSTHRADIQHATNKMMEVVEENFGSPMMPIVLCTELTSSGVKAVRNVIAGRSEEAKKLLAEATDYNISIWTMASNDFASLKLMGLH